jgi:hypothetical protein
MGFNISRRKERKRIYTETAKNAEITEKCGNQPFDRVRVARYR